MKKKVVAPILLLFSAIIAFLLFLLKRESDSSAKSVLEPYNTLKSRVDALLKRRGAGKDFTAQKLLDELGEPRDSIESVYNKSIEHILDSFRTTHAAKLLTSTDDTISCIAETVGYANASTMYRPFKREYHMSPTQFRESTRGNNF